MTPPPEEALALEFRQSPFLSSLARRKAGWLELKYSLDRLLALTLLVVFLPILVTLVLLIKLTSKGPAIYRQKRIGENGRLFEILKLRTMHTNAEADTGPVLAKPNDPRVTRVGRFLRSTNLDKLPQLVGVIRGDMSFVGPAAHRPDFANHFRGRIRQYLRRVAVRPGITGLAQVCYRDIESIEDARKIVAYDLLYLRESSFRLDLGIAFLSFGFLTRGSSR